MTLLQSLRRTKPRYAGNIDGVVIGVVTNNEDPDGLNRIKVKFPWLSDEDESNWARVTTPMAGKEMGIFFLPEIGDEVLISFEFGDVNRPFVVGSLWNGVEKPPFTNDDGKNNIRAIKSRSGHLITFDDSDGAEKIIISDKSEKNLITIDTKENTISIETGKDIKVSCPDGKFSVDATDIEMKASGSVKLESGSSMDVKASGELNAKGATINLN